MDRSQTQRQKLYVYCAVTLPNRHMYYFAANSEGLCWTNELMQATVFSSKNDAIPPGHLKQLAKETCAQDIEHLWIELRAPTEH